MTDADRIVQISSLMSSRLCHDLVNPVGALSTGLDVLSEGGDPDLEAHAISLIKESTDKSIAVLSLARLAYGSSGGFEGDLDMNDAKNAAVHFYTHSKAELDWQLAEAALPKWEGRALLNILIAVERCVPRPDSRVLVTYGDVLKIEATGPKVKFSDEMAAAFAVSDELPQPKDMPAYLAGLLAQTGGARIETAFENDVSLTVTLKAD